VVHGNIKSYRYIENFKIIYERFMKNSLLRILR
jgi:hypothetical protein